MAGSETSAPIEGASTPASGWPSDNGAVVQSGSVEDRYESLFLIGRGGMGRVEVALERGAGDFKRIVALKRMLPEGARDPRHVQMFLREARLAALLKHANVVHAFAFGELREELFLAMEYVAGEPLTRVVASARSKEGGLLPSLVAYILARVCDGLHAAHELADSKGQPLNVVHRDISPHNVMVGYDGTIKLLDFGVAKLDAEGNQTRTGEVKGKMAYMSPQQAMGDPLDRRSDLFSLGAVLFECITGERMWGNGTDVEIMRKLALEEPPRLDAAAPSAPAELVRLHARLVSRDPSQRPSTAGAVAEELRTFIAASGTRPDGRVVNAMMMRLFREEAERKRRILTGALERAAPTRVEALRESLEPLSPEIRAALSDRPPANMGTSVDSGMVSNRPIARPRRGAVFVTALLALALGAGFAVVAAKTGWASRWTNANASATTTAPANTAGPTANAATASRAETTTTATAPPTTTVAVPATQPAATTTAPANPTRVPWRGAGQSAATNAGVAKPPAQPTRGTGATVPSYVDTNPLP